MGIYEPDLPFEIFIQVGDQSGPEGRYGAGAANDHTAAVDDHFESSVRVGIAGDVRNSASFMTRFADRNPGGLLVIRQVKELADATAAGASVSPANTDDGWRAKLIVDGRGYRIEEGAIVNGIATG